MKKVLVVSHERSGTYFLAETIALNFGYRSYDQRVDLDDPCAVYCDPQEMQKALSFGKNNEPLVDMPFARILKSHHCFDFFAEILPFLFEQYSVFYIYRDGRDVMTSMWRHAWQTAPAIMPRAFTAGQFMRSNPCGYFTERYHGKFVPANMVERWQYHVASWVGPRIAGVCYISYETMLEHFDWTIGKIASALGRAEPAEPEVPKLGGVNPWRGKSGNWKEFLDEEDVDYFWRHAKYGMGVICAQREPEVFVPVGEKPRTKMEAEWLGKDS